MHEPVRERARAKVNLYLHVLGRRADGMHELDSLVVFPEIFDRVTLSPADSFQVRMTGPFAAAVPADRDNIVHKATCRLADRLGTAPAAAICLHKSLPVAAGVGGGSADAAAVLRGLPRLWQREISSETLRTIAAELGADVPMCLSQRPARIHGIGHEIEPVSALPDAAILLANPGTGILTQDVFARSTRYSPPAPLSPIPSTAEDLAAELSLRRNDLEAAAISLAPCIAVVLESLRETGGCLLSRMSGSGATCFALYRRLAEARQAGSELRARHPAWWLAAASL